VIPLRDDIPSRTFPLLVYCIVAACAVAFFHTLTLRSSDDAQRLILTYGVIPAQFTGHAPPVPAALPVRLLTSLFLHAGWLHIGGNMLFLWIFGDNIEDAMGHGPFLVFYLVCGVAANLIHILTIRYPPIPRSAPAAPSQVCSALT